MTLREILKERGVTFKTISDALGIHPNNMPRYDDLMKRSVEEVLIISKASGIDPSELIGFNISSSEKTTPAPSGTITQERLFAVIESQQRTIENLSKK